MSLLDFEKTEVSRPSWKRDLVVIGLWLSWLLLVTAMGLPKPLQVTGLSFVLLYATWAWGFQRTAFWFLWVSWIFSAFSLMPAGLLWLSLMIVFGVMKLVRFRFLIDQGPQMALAVFLVSLGLLLVQGAFLSVLQDSNIWSLEILLSLFSQAFIEGVLASILFRPLKSVQLIR